MKRRRRRNEEEEEAFSSPLFPPPQIEFTALSVLSTMSFSSWGGGEVYL